MNIAQILCKMPAFNTNGLPMDQAVCNFFPGSNQDALKRRSGYLHLRSALLLFHPFQVLEAKCFQFFQL